MSIKIHHGPPGSYKTSGALADDFIKAVLDGRHIITNVRGLDDEDRVREVLEGKGKTVPASFKLSHIDTSESEKMEMLRRFWHWAPDGVFFVIDEVQEVWPKSLREPGLRKLEYPGGVDAATAAGTFLTIDLAFEKHRHRNWDFIVTTPNISKVHSVVRGAAEAAYKHKNLAMIGAMLKGRYVEGFHAADTNGKPSDFYSVVQKRIPAYVFDLYKSTATGVVSDTTAGQSLFANPRILLLLGILAAVLTFVFTAGLPSIFGGKPKDDTPVSVQPPDSPPVAVPPVTSATQALVNSSVTSRPNLPNVADGQNLKIPPLLAFIAPAKLYYSGGYALDPESVNLSAEFPDGTTVKLGKKQLLRAGMQLVDRGGCMAELYVNGKSHTFVLCPPPPVEPIMMAKRSEFAQNSSQQPKRPPAAPQP